MSEYIDAFLWLGAAYNASKIWGGMNNDVGRNLQDGCTLDEPGCSGSGICVLLDDSTEIQ